VVPKGVNKLKVLAKCKLVRKITTLD